MLMSPKGRILSNLVNIFAAKKDLYRAALTFNYLGLLQLNDVFSYKQEFQTDMLSQVILGLLRVILFAGGNYDNN